MINVVVTMIIILGLAILAMLAYSACRYYEIHEERDEVEKTIAELRARLKEIMEQGENKKEQ